MCPFNHACILGVAISVCSELFMCVLSVSSVKMLLTEAFSICMSVSFTQRHPDGCNSSRTQRLQA